MIDPEAHRVGGAPDGHPRVALVLAGGGARGAYEAGVLAFLIEDLPKRLGFMPSFDIVSGASVGAIHAAYWTATLQEDAATRVARLTSTWDSMSLERVYRLSVGDLLRIPSRLFSIPFLTSTPAAGARLPTRLPGLLDTSALEEMVLRQIPWRQLRSNLRASRQVLCISCTEIASGRAVVFVDGARVSLKAWEYDPYVIARSSGIGPSHILASAAIPLLFPAVRIGRHFYCDGGLRLNTPLSPALRLGADRLLLVALRHPPDAESEAAMPSPRETAYGNPAYLIGKVLNAMMLDHIDYDLQRMRLMNALLQGGEQAFGAEFLPKINEIIRATRGTNYRVIQDCVIRPSEDLGKLAGRCYSERSRSLSPARLVADLIMRSAAHGVPEGEADLLSYVLFDGSYTRQLFTLGRADAAGQADQIAQLFVP
ncbi:MAG: patatin-like phospholipase family protein [Candidatus Binatia bacterium]